MRTTAVLGGLFILCIWYNAGYWIMRLLKQLPLKRNSSALLLLIGVGVIGNGITVMGFTQTMRPGTVIVMLGIVFISGFFGPFQFWVLHKWHNRISFYKHWYAGVSFVFILVYFIRGLLPPTGIDGLMYHLSVPKLYLEHGGFYPIPWNNQAHLPMLGEMNYLIGIAFQNPVLCKLTAFSTGVLLCCMIFLIGQKILNSHRAAGVALLLFLAHPTTVAGFSQCNVDILAAAFTLGSFWYLYHYDPARDSVRCLIPGIILLCFTVQTKAFGIFVVPVAGIFLFAQMKKMRPVKPMAIFMTVVLPLVAGSLWYSKSMVYTGVPVPGLEALNPYPPDAVADRMPMLKIIMHRCMVLARNIVVAPWSYSLLDAKHRMDSFGPLFLGIIPFAVCAKKKNEWYALLFWGVGLWFFFIVLSSARGTHGGMSIRYMTAVVALFALVTADIVTGAQKKWVKVFLNICIIFSVTMSLMIAVKRYRFDIVSVISGLPSTEYLMKYYPLYPALSYINNQLPDTASIMGGYCFGTFYLDRPYQCAQQRFVSASHMIDTYRSHGITHILSNNVLDPPANKYEWFEGRGLERVFEKNDFIVYQIPYTGKK